LGPTGDRSCTYTYASPASVRLDDLAGLTREDCGDGRRCRDFADFRQNCRDPAYRWKFDRLTRNATPSPFCVEYDIHPHCQSSCDAAECKALPEEQRELGLPFWRGRCDVRRNIARVERLEAAFDELAARTTSELASAWVDEPCTYPSGMCLPDPRSGFMYCSRQWGGVCQPCWIPGTAREHPDMGTHAVCPFDVLARVDYRASPERWPVCRSDLPRELCCLYHMPSSCSVSGADRLPLDDDGYAAALASQDADTMAEFVWRVAEERLNSAVTDAGALKALAGSEASAGAPALGRSLHDLEADMEPFLQRRAATPSTTARSAPASRFEDFGNASWGNSHGAPSRTLSFFCPVLSLIAVPFLVAAPPLLLAT